MSERVLPREFSTPPQFLIPLSNAELQELGTFTAIWSQLDWILLTIFVHLTGTQPSVAFSIMENLTTGPRVGLLNKVCQHEPTERKKRIKELLDSNGGLVEDRNHVLHGMWGLEWEYE